MRKKFQYSEEHQSVISFPLGGIGSGCIGLGGNGRLIDWEIFNRPSKGSYNGLSHFAIRVEDKEEVKDARILNGDLNPPYIGSLGTQKFHEGFGWGPQRESMAGMPHFSKNSFKGTFPIAELGFGGDGFPGEVSMLAFNPFIPHNSKDSSIPAAFFSFTLRNTTSQALTYSLIGVLGNPYKGKTCNQYKKKDGFSMMHLSSLDQADSDISSGSICLASDADCISYQEYLYRGSWFDALEVYWKNVLTQGSFNNRSYPPAEGGSEDNALMAAHISLESGEIGEVRYIISWHHPNNKNDWNCAESTDSLSAEENARCKKLWKNFYSLLWKDSMDSAAYGLREWKRLSRETKMFRDTLFSSSLPEPVLDAVSANLSILKSPTVWRLEDGTLYGWEGVGEKDSGCCEGSCTHVWAYSQVLPFLFPELSRGMREAEYRHNWDEDGSLSFRLMLPLGTTRWEFRPAVDGQFATIMKVYREWKICGDDEWLRRLWPKVRKSVEFAWNRNNADLWDPQKSGILSGRQHHTLDMELFGPNAWLSGMYLGALKASSEMAQVMGDQEAADEYMSIFFRGCEYLNKNLYNGEYFFQDIDLSDKTILNPYLNKNDIIINNNKALADAYWNEELNEIKYQIGDGVSIDQMLGQWHADLYGIGDIFGRTQVTSALNALMKYNFREKMRDHYNPCRIYCLNDESGLVIAAWPDTVKKPAIPAPYSQETMHGFEYACADLMIKRGLIEAGLKVVKGVRDRYDGRRRNPWNEFECGSNYARSMASYALLLSFSGFSFDGRTGFMAFNPIISGDISYFWSFRSAWGCIERKAGDWIFTVCGGSIPLKSMQLQGGESIEEIRKDGSIVDFHHEGDNIVFNEEVILDNVLTFRSQVRKLF